MLICDDCRKRAEKNGKTVLAFDNGVSAFVVDNRPVLLKHCAACGKLMVIAPKIQEFIR